MSAESATLPPHSTLSMPNTPPLGDEQAVADHLAARRMRIMYAYQGPAGESPGWPAIYKRRKFNYLNADTSSLWAMVRRTEFNVAPNERKRIQEELSAATWIRTPTPPISYASL